MEGTDGQTTTRTGTNVRRALILSLGLLLFTLSWKVSWNSIALALVLLAALAQVVWAPTTLRWQRWRPLVWAYAGYTAICLLSLLWTANMREGWFQAGKMLPLVLLPVIVCIQRNPLTPNEQRQLYGWTGAGLASLMVWAYSGAWQEYQLAHDSVVFFSHDLVWRTGRNAIDLSRTAAILLLFTTWYGNRNWYQMARWQRYAILPLCLLWAVILLLLASKLLIGMTLLLLLLMLALGLRSAPRDWSASVALLVVAVAVAVPSLPSVRARFDRTLRADARTPYHWGQPLPHAGKAVDYDELTMRLVMWETGLKLIPQAPWLGYGIGDVIDTTEPHLTQRGVSTIYLRMDQHNQLLQTALTAGVLGLLALAWLLWQLLVTTWRSRNILLWVLLLLLLSNLLFEAVLARHFSIVFFALVPCLVLWANPPPASTAPLAAPNDR